MMSFFMWNQIVLEEKNSILLLKNLTGNKFLHIFSLEVSPRCIHIICGCKYIGSIHQLDVNIETWCNNPLILAMLLMFWGHSLNKNRKWICYVFQKLYVVMVFNLVPRIMIISCLTDTIGCKLTYCNTYHMSIYWNS